MSYSEIVMISSLAEDVKNEYLRAFSSQLSGLMLSVSGRRAENPTVSV
jgi:hypothetical protein